MRPIRHMRQPMMQQRMVVPDQQMGAIRVFIGHIMQYIQWYYNQPTVRLSSTRNISLKTIFSTGFRGVRQAGTTQNVRQAINAMSRPQNYVPFLRQRQPRWNGLGSATIQRYLNRQIHSMLILLQNLRNGLGVPRLVILPMNPQQRNGLSYQLLRAQLPQQPVNLDRRQFLLYLICSQVFYHLTAARRSGQYTQHQWLWIINKIYQVDNFKFFVQNAMPQPFNNIRQWMDVYQNWAQRLAPLQRYILPQFVWLFRSRTRQVAYNNQVVQLTRGKFHHFQGIPQQADYDISSLSNLSQGLQVVQRMVPVLRRRQGMQQGFQPQFYYVEPRYARPVFPFQLSFQYGFDMAIYRIYQTYMFTQVVATQEQQIFSDIFQDAANNWHQRMIGWFYIYLVMDFNSGWKTWYQQIQYSPRQFRRLLFQDFNNLFFLSDQTARQFITSLTNWVNLKQNQYLINSQSFQIGYIRFGQGPALNLWNSSPNRFSRKFLQYDLCKSVFFPGQFRQNMNWFVFDPDQVIQGQDISYRKWVQLQQTKSLLMQNYSQTQASLCWVKVINYIFRIVTIKTHLIGQCYQHFSSGHFWKGIDMLKLQTGWGFYNNIEHQRDDIIQQSNHFYLSGRHLTIMTWKQLKKKIGRLNTKNTYHTSNITTKKVDGAITDRILPTIKNNLNSWKTMENHYLMQKGQPVPFKKLPMEHLVDTVIFKNCLFVDIECLSVTNQIQKCYLSCMIGCPYGYATQNQWKFWDNVHYTAAQSLVNQIKAFSDYYKYTKSQPLTIWFFNGIKYEMSYFYKTLQVLFGIVNTLGQPGNSKGFSVAQQSIVFRDARCLLPVGTLKQLSRLYSKNKQQEKQQFDIVQITQQYHAQENRESITKYCLQDCYSLAYLIRNHYEGVQLINQQLSIHTNRPKISFAQIYKKITTPGLAVFFMFYYFLQQHFSDNQPQQVKKLQRKGYFGGMTQIFKHVVQQRIQSFDINSSYPKAMTQQMPWFFEGQLDIQQARSIYQTRQNWSLAQDTDFILVSSFDHKGKYPWIPFKHSTGLIYPNSCLSGQFYIWGRQLRACPHTQIKVSKVYRYSNVLKQQGKNIPIQMTKKYVQFFYAKKLKMKQQKNPIFQAISKLFLNSAYGKLAQKKFFSHTLVSDQWQFKVQSLHKVSFTKWGTLYSQAPRDGPSVGDFVRVASYISATGRANLACTANLVGLQNVFYCDTDSLYVRQGTFPMHLVSDKVLGKWKKEQSFFKALYIAPKCSISLMQRKQDQKKGITYGGNWKYKWKGVPMKMMKKNDPIQMYQDFKWDIIKLANGGMGQVYPYKSYLLSKCIQSQRWARMQQGIMIQHFWRRTSIWIKKHIKKDTSLISFDI